MAGLGIAPKITTSGTGVGARLWISYLGSSDSTDPSADEYSEISYCTIRSNDVPLCQMYFSESSRVSNLFRTRGHIIDTVNKLILVPMQINFNAQLSVFSLGLKPEL